MTFGEKLKNARKLKKLTQRQLADHIKAKHNSVSDWENDKNKPDPDLIEMLCGILDITPNYLLNVKESVAFSPYEKEFIEKYRLISEKDTDGKELVDNTVEYLYKRCSLPTSDTVANPNPVSMRLVSYYYKNASAGTGQILFDMPPTKQIEIPNTAKYACISYAIGVEGSSMLPIYDDGDTLLVEMTKKIEIGEIGIFQINGDCFVKKLGESELISLNKDYANVPLNESASCMGKVIGKL